MRLWLTCLFLFCATFGMVSSVGPIGVKIISITRSKKAADQVLKVCHVTNGIWDTAAMEKSTLEIISTEPNFALDKTFKYYTNQDDAGADCIFFGGDIAEHLGKAVTFILEGRDAEGKLPIVFGEAKFTIPASLLDDGDVEAQLIVEKQNVGSDEALRLKIINNNNLGTWKVCVDDTIKSNVNCQPSKKLCYAIEAGGTVDSSLYSLCIEAIDGDKTAILNATPFIPTSAADTLDDTDDKLDNVILSYETTKLSITSAKIGANLEFFVTYKVPENQVTKDAYAVCPGGSGTACSLPNYVPSTESMEIIIVVLDNGVAKKSRIIPFEDFNIEGVPLGKNIIELIWEKGVKNIYGAHVDETAKTILQDVIVDCRPSFRTDYCFAYFVELTANTPYHVTVVPADNADPPDDKANLEIITTNEIKAKSITTAALYARQLEVVLQHDLISVDNLLNVCYKASESSHNNTRHEAIIIDQDGHWIKIHEYVQVDDLMHCFSPVDLLTSALKITKDTKLTAVVVERELTGYQVLASGQMDIDLSALRVIKPDVNNSNEGSMSTLAIVGAAIGGVACLMALVAAAILVVMKRKKSNDGLQYPLQRSNVEDYNITYSLDNPNSTN